MHTESRNDQHIKGNLKSLKTNLIVWFDKTEISKGEMLSNRWLISAFKLMAAWIPQKWKNSGCRSAVRHQYLTVRWHDYRIPTYLIRALWVRATYLFTNSVIRSCDSLDWSIQTCYWSASSRVPKPFFDLAMWDMFQNIFYCRKYYYCIAKYCNTKHCYC